VEIRRGGSAGRGARGTAKGRQRDDAGRLASSRSAVSGSGSRKRWNGKRRNRWAPVAVHFVSGWIGPCLACSGRTRKEINKIAARTHRHTATFCQILFCFLNSEIEYNKQKKCEMKQHSTSKNEKDRVNPPNI
jgi:hypothetical protein